MGSAISRRNPGSTTDGQEMAELESIRIDGKHEPEQPEPAAAVAVAEKEEDPDSIQVVDSEGSAPSASTPLLDPDQQR